MPISSVNQVKTVGIKLDSNSESITTIYQNTEVVICSEFLPNYKIVSFNTFLKNLKVFASIKSLDEVALPEFALDDSQTTKLQKVLDIEWNSPRKQLDVYLQSNNQGWLHIGSTSMLNPSGYQFRIYNIMDLFTDNLALELGINSKVGIGVKDVCYGLLTPQDTVVIHGSYVEEIFLESKEPPININVTVAGGTGVITPPTDYKLGNSGYIDNSFLITN